MEEYYFTPVSEEEITRERQKAKEARRSQWWKRRLSSGRCHYCGGGFPPSDLTMDHRVPLVRGGKSTKSNLVPCCQDCNREKKYLLPVEWEAYLERLGTEES